MSTYTESLGLELITPGSQAGLWGNTTNNTFTLIDQAITGVTPISFASASGTTYTLTDYNGAEDEARAAVLNITGTATGSNTVVIPNKQKTYLVRNETSRDIVFQTLVATTPYTVLAGYNTLIFCDGNNGVFAGIRVPGASTLGVSGGGTGKTTFTAGFVKSPGGTADLVTAATVNAASEISGVLPVTNGGTGASSLINNGILIGKGTGTVDSLVGGTTGYIPTWNGTTWVSAPPASGGVSSVAVNSPLTLTGTATNPVINLPTLAIANGGTGATTASAALTNLGALSASSGVAYDSSRLGGTLAASYATLSGTQTFTGAKTFTGSITSTIYTLASGMSIERINASLMNFYVQGTANLALTPSQLYTYGAALKPGGGSWSDSSDERLKENVVPLAGALEKITSLNPVSYEWKYDRADVSNVGFIAQEVAPIFPLAITETDPTDQERPFIPNGEKVKNIGWQNDMTAYLVGAIKELKAELDAAKAKIAALEAK